MTVLGRYVFVFVCLFAFLSPVAFAETLDTALPKDTELSSVEKFAPLITHDVLLQNKPALISISAEHGLLPDYETIICLVDVWCSKPVRTDVNGQLYTQIVLPSEIKDGHYKLIVKCDDSKEGKPTSIFKKVEVGGDPILSQVWPKG